MLTRVFSATDPATPLTHWCWRGLLVAAVMAASACTSSPSGQRQPAAQAPTRSAPKSITIAFPIDPTALAGSMSGLGLAAVPSRYFREFDNAYLTTYNQQDEPVPWLATDMPSLDDGTWKVLEDDRMEVFWKLQKGAKWHD